MNLLAPPGQTLLGVVGLSVGAGQVSAMKALNLQAVAKALPTAEQTKGRSSVSAGEQSNEGAISQTCCTITMRGQTLLIHVVCTP